MKVTGSLQHPWYSHSTWGQQSPDIVPVALAYRLPTASHDVIVRGYRTQHPKITLSKIPTCMTPGQLRSGAQLHSFYTHTWPRLGGSRTEHPNKTSNMIDLPKNGSAKSTTVSCFQKNGLLHYHLYRWKLFSTGDFHAAGIHLRPCECQNSVYFRG